MQHEAGQALEAMIKCFRDVDKDLCDDLFDCILPVDNLPQYRDLISDPIDLPTIQ